MMTTPLLLLVMVAISGTFAVMALHDMRRDTRRAAARMQSIGGAARAQRRVLRANVQRTTDTSTLAGVVKAIVERLQLLSSKEAATGRKLLVNAGIRRESALSTFLFLRVSMPMAFGAAVLIDGVRIEVRLGGEVVALAARPPARGANGLADDARVVAPMPGRVLALDVRAGQTVVAGDRLLVLEAMKMEHRLLAKTGGTVAAVHVAEGDQVADGMLLVEIDR